MCAKSRIIRMAPFPFPRPRCVTPSRKLTTTTVVTLLPANRVHADRRRFARGFLSKKLVFWRNTLNGNTAHGMRSHRPMLLIVRSFQFSTVLRRVYGPEWVVRRIGEVIWKDDVSYANRTIWCNCLLKNKLLFCQYKKISFFFTHCMYVYFFCCKNHFESTPVEIIPGVEYRFVICTQKCKNLLTNFRSLCWQLILGSCQGYLSHVNRFFSGHRLKKKKNTNPRVFMRF